MQSVRLVASTTFIIQAILILDGALMPGVCIGQSYCQDQGPECAVETGFFHPEILRADSKLEGVCSFPRELPEVPQNSGLDRMPQA
jgi:hypothetical protein